MTPWNISGRTQLKFADNFIQHEFVRRLFVNFINVTIFVEFAGNQIVLDESSVQIIFPIAVSKRPFATEPFLFLP